MSQIENSICEAIELIVNKAIAEASYDKTIQAVIKSCVDASIGKYKVTYQDSSFYAYATSADVAYSDGSSVYILIPGNDMSKDKTILGTVDKLGINYVTQAEGDEAYDYIGTNCISTSGTYELSSYREPNSPTENPSTYLQVIYADGVDSSLTVDTTSLSQYIKESSSLICGAVFRTALNAEQQYKGNYGIIFGLDFTDNANANATGITVTRYYTVDIDNMVGDPYNLNLGKRQYGIFDIDGANFNKLSSISLFTKDFPYTKTDEEIAQQNLLDITVSDIEISGATIMSEDEQNGCGISFYTPDGAFFGTTAKDDATLRITANVKMRGKKVDTSIQKIPFYWFREDLSIVAKSPCYSKYGGRGWRCLNSGNLIAGNILTSSGEAVEGYINNGKLYNKTTGAVISHGSLSSDAQVEWVSASDTYTFSIEDATAAVTKLKCAILYDGTVYTKTIEIKNLNNMPVITIESDSGTQFYYDIGRPNLTCTVQKWSSDQYVDDTKSSYTYIWAVEDLQGNLTNLPEDEVQNATDYAGYVAAKKALAELQAEIAAGTKFANAEADNLQTLQANVDNYKNIQIINSNQVLNVAINAITTAATYKCSVYNDDTYLGTASLKLTNTLDTQDVYTLIINNGTQTFQYNEYGVSPASASLENPISIPTLTFSIYDNLGNLLEDSILKNCTIKWEFPIANTMLEISAQDGEEGGISADQTYQYYNQAMNLAYKINDKYYYNYKVNDIKLTVDYKGMSLTAHTNLTFVKQGESGTNGTSYTCKIVPNSSQTNLPKYPTLTIVEGNDSGYLNFKYSSAYANNILINNRFDDTQEPPFIVKLYKAGEEIYSGYASGQTISDDTGESTPVTIKWEMLANTYNKTSNLIDSSDLTINENNGRIKYTGEAYDNNIVGANIIKCTIYYGTEDSDTRYSIYATMPIIIARVAHVKYHINLKEDSGFRYVEYTSDGTIPKYDTTSPFEIEVTETINDIDETVSLLEGDHGVNSFNWDNQSRVYDFANKEWTTTEDLIHLDSGIYTSKLEVNQREFKPATNYNGLCVNNTVVCQAATDEDVVGTIYIPIHFFLNKYGLAELNGWDGNSISIDEDGGFILAPEMGAGRKETDNTFTGVLMGEVQEPNRTTSDVGLLGYNHGERSFFVDSEDGHTILGSGAGKVAIDPSQNKALLYSDNFWKSYNEKGLPGTGATATNYNYRDNSYRSAGNGNGEGLLIDLSTPEIFFGNGTFYVSSDGYIHARGGGDIGGWGIDDYALFSQDGANQSKISATTGMSSAAEDNDLTSFGTKTYETSQFIEYNDGTNTYNRTKVVSAPTPGEDGTEYPAKAIAFWAGNNTKPKFYVTHDGYLRCNDAAIGSGSANLIYIGKSAGDNTQSALFTIKKSSLTASADGFYLGADGFSLGSTHTVSYNNTSKTVSQFQVDKNGTFYARNGYIGNSTTGWEIGDYYLRNGLKTSYADGEHDGIYIGNNGIGLGKQNSSGILPFYVSSAGALHAMSGNIANWTITSSSIRTSGSDWDGSSTGSFTGMYLGSNGIRLGSTFSVNTAGQLTSTSGTIGGWTIGSNSISKGTVSLGSDGSITNGNSWSINANGSATFSNLKVTGGYITLGGTTLSSGDISGTKYGTTLSGGSTGVTSTGGSYYGTLDSYCKAMTVDALNVSSSLTFQSRSCKWQNIKSISGIHFNINCQHNVKLPASINSQGEVSSWYTGYFTVACKWQGYNTATSRTTYGKDIITNFYYSYYPYWVLASQGDWSYDYASKEAQ